MPAPCLRFIPLAYTIKFALKAETADFVVPPLEALWWADDPSAFVRGERSEWQWTTMLRMPATVMADHLAAANKPSARKPAKQQKVGSVRT